MLTGDVTGIVEGYSYVRISDLAEIETELVSEGIVQILFINRDYELVNTNEFFPPLELYDFPLKLNDQWELSSNIITSGIFIIEDLVDEEYSVNNVLDVTVQCTEKEILSVPAGDFDCFKITYSSDTYWYSPDVGNIVKSVVEQRNRDYTFNMDLTLQSYYKSDQLINISENIDPSEAFVNQDVVISGYAKDSNNNPIQNGDISVELPILGESWNTNTDDNGYYTLTIQAPYFSDDTPSSGEFGSDGVIVKCSSGELNGFLVKTLLIIENFPPNTPTINGPTSGKIGEEHDYSFSASDSEEDDIYYWVDWDDGQTEEWIGPYESSEEVVLPHTWDEEGTYIVKSKAKDSHGSESDWAELEVTMPRNKLSDKSLFLHFFEKIVNNFPFLHKIFGLLGK